MTHVFKKLALAATVAFFATSTAQAHRFWILPSSTVVSGQDQWVTFDAAISNDLFFPGYHGIALKTIAIKGPDGSALEPAFATEGHVRTTFELQLKQEGTYKTSGGTRFSRAKWTENGEEKSFQGSISELFAKGIPAKNPSEMYILNRVTQTYVTLGAPTDTVLAVEEFGVEFDPITHPNDLFAGEEAHFRILKDGSPLKGQAIDIVAAGDRYRNDVGATKVTTNEDGIFSITWPSAGRYFFEIDSEGSTTENGVTIPVYNGLGVVLEVLPQ